MQRPISAILLILTAAANVGATDYCILPQGTGSQNASNWENAAPPVELRGILAQKIKPGERIFLHCSGPDDYWNRDGFTAERGVSGVYYEGCLALGNTDGGWDDESTAPTLVNCIAVGNKRAIRIWNAEGDAQHPARLINCIGAYSVKRGGIASTAGLWTCGSIVAERCTFHNNPSAAVSVEKSDRIGHAVLRNCILSRDWRPVDSPLITTDDETACRTENTMRWPPSTDTPDPAYVVDNRTWKGQPQSALTNRRYGPTIGAWFPANPATNSTNASWGSPPPGGEPLLCQMGRK